MTNVPERKTDREPGRLRIEKALEKGPLGYKDLWEETGLRGNLLSKYLKEMQLEGKVERDINTRRYRFTSEGMKALRAGKEVMFLERHPPIFSVVSLGIDNPSAYEDGYMMDIDFSHSVSLSYDSPIKDLMEIFEKRSHCARNLFMTELLELACRKGLMDKTVLQKDAFFQITPREWRRIFQALCPKGHELIWLERVDLRNLLAVLTHPRLLESGTNMIKFGPIKVKRRGLNKDGTKHGNEPNKERTNVHS